MLKRILLSATAIALMIGAASAADLSVRAPVLKAPPMFAPAFSWSGFYIGGHGGFGWGRESDNQSSLFECIGPCPDTGGGGGADKFDVDGFIAGGHIGYNWQSGVYVFGIEGDADATGLKGNADFIAGSDDTIFTGNLSFKSLWQASIRLRAGYAIDRTLLYVTGGVAFGEGKFREILIEDEGTPEFATDKHVHVGWTVGGGIEHAFTPNWIGRIEARYTDFGSNTYVINRGDPADVSWTQTTVTGGISYKF